MGRLLLHYSPNGALNLYARRAQEGVRGLTSTTRKADFDIGHVTTGVCYSLVEQKQTWSESQMQLLTAFSIHIANNRGNVGT